MMTVASTIRMVWLMPSMIARNASGSCTFNSSWRLVAPKLIAASRGVNGTSRRPRLVSRMQGGIA